MNSISRCFYVGLKTSVSIGINPKPGRDRPLQMVFMGSLWLMGVFVFAVLIGSTHTDFANAKYTVMSEFSQGNVKDIIAESTRNQDEYQFQFDRLSQYMHSMGVPQETVSRVKRWCQYTWQTQKSFDELGKGLIAGSFSMSPFTAIISA